MRKAQELGLINAHVPEEYGGLGLGCTEGCMINEAVAYGCSGIGTALEANSLGVSGAKRGPLRLGVRERPPWQPATLTLLYRPDMCTHKYPQV